MKRLFSLLLILSVLMSGCGLSDGQEPDGVEALFYYVLRDSEELASDETITAETRYLKTISMGELLETYLAGPDSDDLMSPFPSGTRVLDMQSSGDNLTLVLSMEFFMLSGVEKTVAECCLVNTLCTFTGLNSITLTDELDSIHLKLSPDQYKLSNSVREAAETYTLYFADSDRRYLIPETRDATLSQNETAMAYVVRQLLDGPESSQLLSVIPEGTKFLNISLENGVCSADFSEEFYCMDDSYAAYMAIYSVTNTLTGLDGIDSVLFLQEGEPAEQCGIFPLNGPVSRNEDAIGPVRTAGGEIDINVYAFSETGDSIFAVPCRVRQTVSEPLAYAVTMKVLNYELPVGFYNPIPAGTEVLNISVSGTACYVDLSEQFIPDAEELEQDAVWALVSVLTDLPDVSSVILTIEGESSGLHCVDLSEPLTAQTVEPELFEIQSSTEKKDDKSSSP